MSGLTKKAVYADKVLATILGVKEGTHVSYAELSKGLHRYIKEKQLKNTERIQLTTQIRQPIVESEMAKISTGVAGTRRCRDCGFEIPSEAVYCDLCGVCQ
ncbi:MAG TPA: hypothetical protein VLV18_03570 [Terriglobales bacterium]|nr:hypothetical protein [Terriglobales bacterium]